MRILLWATTLQADILALAFHLDSRADVQLLIVAEGASVYLEQPIAKARPLQAPLLERHDADTQKAVLRFAPDIVVCDNHFPSFAAGSRVCSMWHGLGWKARPRADLGTFYAHVKRLTGMDPRRRNPRFMAQCYGERDRNWRTQQWELAPDSCRVIGMAFSDLLRSPPYRKEDLAPHYDIDIAGRKTLLVNLTWHYGRIVPGSWQPKLFASSPFDADIEFLRRLFARARDHEANVLFCLHDRKRYERKYLTAMHQLARRFEHVELRHKDEHPDNLADLLVADAMVSNLSSFITFMYPLGKPTVHICPDTDESVRFTRLRAGRLVARRSNDDVAWMNSPTDNGGLSAFDLDGTLDAVDLALTDATCCEARASRWLAEHVWRPDGDTCARFYDALRALRETS